MKDREPHLAESPSGEDIYTVTELAEAIRHCLETEFPRVSVMGEIANFKLHTSGHCYLSLRDEVNLVRVVVFRRYTGSMDFAPRDGQMAIATGRISHYGGSGQTQVIAESLRSAGEGEMALRKRKLLLKLMNEGLTDPSRKRKTPRYPGLIAVVTSPTGAVIRDIRRTVARRWPMALIRHYPVPVQGAGAVPAILEALRAVDGEEGIDAVILARGGGSAEDLWIFNSEEIARAVSSCRFPVVTGIGHEVDDTVCDHVADIRAGTPTAAAEMVTPDLREVRAGIGDFMRRMEDSAAENARRRLEAVEFLLRSSAFPAIRHLLERSSLELDMRIGSIHDSSGSLTREMNERVERMRERVVSAVETGLRRKRLALSSGSEALVSGSPAARVAAQKERARRLEDAVASRCGTALSLASEALEGMMRTLSGLGPQETLKRGYSFCTGPEGKGIIGSVEDLSDREAIEVHFHDGEAACRVEERRRKNWRRKRTSRTR